MRKYLAMLCTLAMVTSLVGCQSKVVETHTSVSNGFGGEVSVTVTFENDKITNVEVVGDSETAGIGSNAIEQLPAKIVEANGVEVDVVSGATITSKAILNATKKAIKAKNGEVSSVVEFTEGTYTGVAKGYKGDVKVSVTVDSDSIKSVEVVEQGETFGIGQGMDTSPVESLPGKIVALQGLGVDTVTGATVTSNAVINATLEALSQASEDASALLDVKEVHVAKDETYDVDVVVVGAGTTGLSAAIEAAENGANVLLVEKQSIVGGAAARSGGKLMAAGTEYQTAVGVEDNPQKMFDYLKGVGGDYIDDAKLMAFCENSLDVFNWMVDMGVKVQDVEPIHKSLPDWRVHNTLGGGGMTNGHGGQITVPMYNYYKGLNQGLIYDTAIDTIIMDNGKAVGVSGTKSDGSKVTVNAKSVILATGGYAQNGELVETYGQKFPYYVASTPMSNMGDGTKMAEAVGAQTFDNPAVQVVFLNFYSGVGINEEPGLILNHEGKRVANEFTYQYHVSDKLAQSGSTSAWYIATKNDPTPTVQYGMTLDSTLKASSIEELAGLMGVDATTLKATIDRYNELATKGVDEDFGKPAEYMYPITGDTYYALNMLPSVTVTYSGIVTDINAQVLDTNGNVISGLYAAGETAFPGLFGTEYPGCGMAISGGAYYGRVAGKLAAERK